MAYLSVLQILISTLASKDILEDIGDYDKVLEWAKYKSDKNIYNYYEQITQYIYIIE